MLTAGSIMAGVWSVQSDVIASSVTGVLACLLTSWCEVHPGLCSAGGTMHNNLLRRHPETEKKKNIYVHASNHAWTIHAAFVLVQLPSPILPSYTI